MKKYKLIILSVILLLQIGCQSYILSHFDDIEPVWTENTQPTIDVKPPEGFIIKPKEAFEIVRKNPWSLSLKHIWHIYADSKYYYVHDSFLGSNSSLAKRYGVRIDGQTGEIQKITSK